MGITQKKRTVMIFVAVMFVFAIILSYLLFFNTGLEVESTYTQEQKEIHITVKNNSMHAIRNITVNYVTISGDEKEIDSIEKLAPEESKEILLKKNEEMEDFVDVIVRALFHQSVSKRIIVGESQEQSGLSYSVTAPEYAFTGLEYVIKIGICNPKGRRVLTVKVLEQHSKDFFIEENRNMEKPIIGDECEDFLFEFIPKKQGKTEIYFNIKAGSYSKSFEQKVSVEE